MYACTCSPAPIEQRCFPHYSGSPHPLPLPIALESRSSTISARGMEAVYYNSVLKEEAAAACQEIYRVTLLPAPGGCSDVLLSGVLSHTALTKPRQRRTDSHKEDLTVISAVLEVCHYFNKIKKFKGVSNRKTVQFFFTPKGGRDKIDRSNDCFIM